MTDAIVNCPTFTLGPVSIPTPRVTGRKKSVNLDFTDEEGRTINELFFESVYAGELPRQKIITITNGGTDNVNLKLQCIQSETNPLGLDIETYLSTFFSVDQINYQKTLDVTVASGGTQTFYLKYQPPSTASPGEKEWTFNPVINDTESGAPPGWDDHRDWLYYDTFTVTGKGDDTKYPMVLTIPYSADIMNTDFSDIRFVNEAGEELGYYIKSKTDGSTATFWIQSIIPDLNETITIYVYSGNPNALTKSDINSVKEWTEDWDLNNENNLKYTQYTLSSAFNLEELGITLIDNTATYQEGNATNNETINDNFVMKTTLQLDYNSFYFYFYLADINNYVVIKRDKVINWAHRWSIGYKSNGTWTELISTEAVYPAQDSGFLRVEIVKNTSIKVYWKGNLILSYIGNFPQAGGKNGFGAYDDWAGTHQPIYIRQPYFVTNEDYDVPTVSSLTGTWKFVSKNLEIKAGLLFKSKYLPSVTPEIKHGLKIGNYFYE